MFSKPKFESSCREYAEKWADIALTGEQLSMALVGRTYFFWMLQANGAG